MLLEASERSALEWDTLLGHLAGRCATDAGKQAARGLEPLPTIDERQYRLRLVSGMKSVIIEHTTPDFGGIHDIAAAARLAERGSVIGLEDVFAIRETLLATARLAHFLTRQTELAPELASRAAELDPLSDLARRLSRSLTDNGELNPAAFLALGRIQTAISRTREDIIRRLNKLMQNPHVSEALQERIHTTCGDRFVLLVKANMRQRVPGSVHDYSASGQTLYIEPAAINPQNSALITLRRRLEEEIRIIVRELSEAIGEHGVTLRANQELLAELDLVTGAARLSMDCRCNEPLLSEKPMLRLYAARHPLLHLLSNKEVIANDVSLGEAHNALIISGANTGGKTVLLKTTALCALMAAHGLHIPASPDSVAGSFERLIVEIGDEQSISLSLSTFSAQIVRLAHIVRESHHGTLVLIDEIISGTNPRYGSALARAALESVVDHGALVITTTHYPELKNLALDDHRFENGNVAFDLDTLRPTYRFSTGHPGASYTLEIAAMYELPQPVIDRARELLDSSDLSLDALIEKVQRYEQELVTERERARELATELETARSSLEARERELKREMRALRERETDSLLRDLNAIRDRVAAMTGGGRTLTPAEAGKAVAMIDQELQRINNERVEIKSEKYNETHLSFDPNLARCGDTVFIPELEKSAVIEEIDLQRREALVRLGEHFKARFAFERLVLPGTAPQKHQTVKTRQQTQKPEPIATSARQDVLTIQTSYNTIDLRGKRADEALLLLDAELDRMSRSGIDAAVVIHGHGTGALKQAVRTALPTSPYVQQYRSGKEGEGGDGVTIVVLR